jgi:protein-S-isoprenylcysteine O-methyltransferase Ste14
MLTDLFLLSAYSGKRKRYGKKSTRRNNIRSETLLFWRYDKYPRKVTSTVLNNNRSNHTRGIARWALQIINMTIITAIILFLSAGRLDWAGGWAFLGLNIFTQLLSAAILIPRTPDLLSERSQVQENTKRWDRFFTPAITIFGTLAIILVAGLDARFAWSAPLAPWLWWLALGLALASQLFVLWAMATNRFFATTVRIQEDRGHQVVSSGPYHFVRHPGYAGSLVYTLSIPLVLGSYWTYIPALITVSLLVVRTFLEDQTLQSELRGYQEYAHAVLYRLIPGVW